MSDRRRKHWRSERIAALGPALVAAMLEAACGATTSVTAPENAPPTAAVTSCTPGDAESSVPYLVRDIKPGHEDSIPSGFFSISGRLFFRASDGEHGSELWATDGTAAGTELVMDVCPGPCHGRPEAFVAAGERILFAADDGVHGRELWVTDGTAAGSRLVADLHPGTDSSDPQTFAPLDDGRVLINAIGPDGSQQLWTTDGTAVQFIRQISKGRYEYDWFRWQRAGSRLFLELRDDLVGKELWVTDGTTDGTVRVTDLDPGPADGVELYGAGELDSILFFPGVTPGLGWDLWRSDGTPRGTRSMGAGFIGLYGVPATTWGDHVFFHGSYSGAAGNGGLWKTDGRLLGTSRVSAIQPCGLFPGPTTLFVCASGDGSLRRRLWTTDGTERGTQELYDIPVSATGPYAEFEPRLFFGHRNLVFFWATDNQHGRELWRSDGTPEGTQLVADINPGIAPGGGNRIAGFGFGDRIYFPASDGVCGEELWAYRLPR